MKTWEQTKITLIKSRIKEYAIAQKAIKEKSKNIKILMKKLNNSDSTLKYMLNKELSKSAMIKKMNASILNGLHIELNLLKNKNSSHNETKGYLSTEAKNMIESFKLTDFCLIFDIDAFYIEEAISITNNEIKTKDDFYKKNQIVGFGSKEDLEIELAKINEKLITDTSKEMDSLNEEYKLMESEYKKRLSALERQIIKMKNDFQESEKEGVSKRREIRTKFENLMITKRKEAEKLFKEITK